MHTFHASASAIEAKDTPGATHGPIVRFKRLHAGATIPAYQTEHAAGLDLHACLDAPVSLGAGEIRVVPLGFAAAIPHGFEGQVRPRSGLATKSGISVPNAPGTVDSDYRGEMKVALVNLGREAFTVEHGMRIAQLVIAPVARAAVVEADELDETSRGSGGFGSTGV
ncbi:MAG: dUTP diphosphatase [Phycisphaerales bacterium]|jgi:dUTP pyrophosphatase|nr:dUTP diphosphatase [Phycisphaerales bacterium]